MSVPAYRDLPVLMGDYRHAWDQFPAGDQFGCLGRITPETRRAALAAVRDGRTIGLSLPLDMPDPPMFGREPFEHVIFAPSRNNLDDRLEGFYLQASTQWDGFRHVRAREHGFWQGYQGDFHDTDALGIQAWARSGIVGRGVLLDVSASYRDLLADGRSDEDHVIEVAHLEAAADAAAVEVRSGDVLCIRTGWLERYLKGDTKLRREMSETQRWPGLSGAADMAERLWDWGIAAVVADNPAVESAPGRKEDGSLHRRLLPLLGMPLGELFDFEDLVRDCRERGSFEFLFAAVPLNLRGGVGSPANAVAVV